MTALPIEIPVSYQEIAHCLDKSLTKVESAILSVLEQTPRNFMPTSYRREFTLPVAAHC
jgi:actin-like ATPase involved in cell morphogenesis